MIRRRPKGFLAFEAIAAATITLALLTIFMLACRQYGQARQIGDARREALAAAQNALVRMQAEGVAADAGEKTLPENDGVRVVIQIAPGSGEWNGMALAHVIATRVTPDGEIRAELAGYCPIARAAP
ncbi:MAG: hypothetical protein HZB38_18545 [Planctomycetes bacterium]|nr:hypothetical protein [Planctomycetota bacterium]